MKWLAFRSVADYRPACWVLARQDRGGGLTPGPEAGPGVGRPLGWRGGQPDDLG